MKKGLVITRAEIEQLSKKYKHRCTNESKVNHFDRIKMVNGKKNTWKKNIRENIYFDTETFELFKDKNNPEELPIIVPYAIGVCTDNPTSYKYYIGIDATSQFLLDLFQFPESSYANLCAYNLDYDFHAIRPWITDNCLHWLEIYYELTEQKKFIFGGLKSKDRRSSKEVPKIDIRFLDLWTYQKNIIGSLDSYMQHILKLTYNDDGSIKDDSISNDLHASLVKWGFTKDSFKKLEQDKIKINLHKKGNDYYYWTSKQDWIDNKPPKKLALEAELLYLRNDVTSMPTIALEQQLMKQLAYQTLSMEKTIDEDYSITAPGFAKYLCEEFTKKYMTETYRVGVSKQVYDKMINSYTGAFTGGNEQITYLDEQVFKEMYPNKSFYDASGKPIIKSYDVNSMYPWAMSLGLPVGLVTDAKPDGEYITWYEIHFKSKLDPKNPDKKRRLYNWKPKYQYLNNSFFGDGFEMTATPGGHRGNKVFILKELWELFDSMTDHNAEIVATRYQSISRELNPFIEQLYKIKRNDEGKWPKSTVELVKLLLNSLYGKMAEKYKEDKIKWASDFKSFIRSNPQFLKIMHELDIEVIDETTKKKQKFKSLLSPYMDLEHQCGFYHVPNDKKRYNSFDEETRESITAGIFITSISRHKLLSTVKGEIDQGNVVLYCDTDSIKLIEFNAPKFECHNKDLGAWKYEGSFHYFGHPNKLKKYFMHNPHETNSKLRWMVKTSGIPTRYLMDANNQFDLDMIKIIYDPNNRVLVKNCKPENKRNEYYQTVIRKTDFKFVFEETDDPISHILDKGILTKYNG